MTVMALNSTNVSKPLGDVWELCFLVLDLDGNASSSGTPAVTITLPGGTTSTPTVDEVATGVYRVAYEVGTAGRYIAKVSVPDYGVITYVAFVAATTAGTAMPDLDDVKDYLEENSFTDEELQSILDAEAAAQRIDCDVPAEYSSDLREALLRRVARNAAMRRLPLALARGDADGGSSDIILGGRDPEVRRLERHYPRLPVG